MKLVKEILKLYLFALLFFLVMLIYLTSIFINLSFLMTTLKKIPRAAITYTILLQEVSIENLFNLKPNRTWKHG